MTQLVPLFSGSLLGHSATLLLPVSILRTTSPWMKASALYVGDDVRLEKTILVGDALTCS